MKSQDIAASAHHWIRWASEEHTSSTHKIVCRNCNLAVDRSEILTALDSKRRPAPLLVCSACSAHFFENDPLASYEKEPEAMGAALAFYLQQGAGTRGMAIRLAGLNRPVGSRYLEIGCGFGLGLDIACRSLGWEGLGVDPSPFAAAGRRTLGLPIEQRLYSIDDPMSGSFDIVHASEFIEHVPDPLGMMLTLRRALAPDGTLLLTTPAAEMIRPDTPEGLLIPLLSVGWHIVLQTESSLSMLLQRAGFNHFRVWREGAQLIALAGNLPQQAREDLAPYRHWLSSVAQATLAHSDLGLGVRARFFRELASCGEHLEAEAAWQDLDAATRQRFRKGLLDFSSVESAPESLEALASSEPLFLGGVLLTRGFQVAQQGGDTNALLILFRAAKTAAMRLRFALRSIGSDDGDAGDVEATAEAEITLLHILDGGKDAAKHLAALAIAGSPKSKMLRWRCFVDLVNRGRFSEASTLGDLVSEILQDTVQLDHLRASVMFCAAAMELQLPKGRHAQAREWLLSLRSELMGSLGSGSPLPAKELYWPCVEAECLALKLLGMAVEAASVAEQAARDVADIPELKRK